jgi:methylmalonyl-CoA mutase, C-terminal domain
MTQTKIRVLLAKPGLDGHDRGVKTVLHALRDAGFDVIYTGLHKTQQKIVELAIEKDVQVIGLSILSGAHLPICAETIKQMKSANIEDRVLIVGGVIPDKDISELHKLGIAGVFPVGSPYEDIVEFIRSSVHGG